MPGLGDRLTGGPAPPGPGLGERLRGWWNNTTFFKPAWDELVGAAALPGDVYSGEQPTMVMDPQTGEFHTAPELMDRAGALAGSMTLGAGAIPAEANALRMGIKAYHGSPHDFERFDSSKIGTGEGAQAYGHGLYLAENEGVAKEYRDRLTGLRTSAATRALDSAGGDVDAAIAGVKAEIERLKGLPNAGNDAAKRDRFISINEEKLAELSALKNSGSMSKGRMYEVSIDAEPEQFLDWDKPLSEQPKALEAIERQWGDPEIVLQQLGLDPKTAHGKDFAAAMEGLGQRNRIGAAEKLQQAGIPGIRYLDQGSRGGPQAKINYGPGQGYTKHQTREAAEKELAAVKDQYPDAYIEDIGSRNYVVFDDKLISILKKYGLPISAAGLAALHEFAPEEAQAAEGLGDRLQSPQIPRIYLNAGERDRYLSQQQGQ